MIFAQADPATPIVAAIAVIPGTIAAVGAWYNSRQANRAVNHRPESEPKLVEMVEDIRGDVRNLSKRFDQHLSWHKEEEQHHAN